MQPEVPFSTTTVKNLKWFGQELTELWNEKSNDEERIFIYLAFDPNVKVTFKVTWYFIWPQSYVDYRDLSDQIVTPSNV